MNQGFTTTGAFTCQHCGRTVQVRARGAVGALRCDACGRQHAVRTRPTDRDRTRIDVEPEAEPVFSSGYGFQ